MDAIVSTVAGLQEKLGKLRGTQLRKYATRVIFIDPLMHTLGWDVRDPDETELEYALTDGQVVDYAMKLDGEPCLFVEARSYNDPLTNVEALPKLVTSALRAGVKWCVLTNGIAYEIYCTTEKPAGAGGLLFKVSLDPEETDGLPIEGVAELLSRFSRDAMARGVLDELGDEVFTAAKIRRALDGLFSSPPDGLIELVRSFVEDDKLTGEQIRTALGRLWDPASEVSAQAGSTPREVTEMFQAVDRFCRQLDPSGVGRQYLDRSVAYAVDEKCFCSVRLERTGLHIWLAMSYDELDDPPSFVRDVSGTEHPWVGDVEVVVTQMSRLAEVQEPIRRAFRGKRGT
ncbi:MAG TPA: hypothetical protein VMY98_08995 [Anaerolineae bacterium]|nr:hypothetical protein [Anaerolineae bacterium]